MTATATDLVPGSLFSALAKAQAKIRNASKDAKNPQFNSKYADLASVWEACRDALTENGICVIQEPLSDGERVGCVTTLGHSSGEAKRSETLWTKPRDQGPQAVGSCVTYLRRYQLAAMVGVAPEDDDGNAGNNGSAPRPIAGGAQPANKVSKGGPPVHKLQLQQIHIVREKIGGWGGDHSHPGHPYAKALSAYKQADGSPCTSAAQLTHEYAANLLQRMNGMVTQQAETASKRLADVGEAIPPEPTREHLDGSVTREPGEDDDGEACDAGDVADIQDAAIERWGDRNAQKSFASWLKAKFSYDTIMELTKFEAKRACEMIKRRE